MLSLHDYSKPPCDVQTSDPEKQPDSALCSQSACPPLQACIIKKVDVARLSFKERQKVTEFTCFLPCGAVTQFQVPGGNAPACIAAADIL